MYFLLEFFQTYFIMLLMNESRCGVTCDYIDNMYYHAHFIL